MNVKKIIYLLLTPLIVGCGGTSEPPFQYKDNSRIVVEGRIIDQNQNPIANQLVQLNGTPRNGLILVNEAYTNTNGEFYLSSPRANYLFCLSFIDKKVFSASLGGLQPPDTYYLFFDDNSTTYYKYDYILLTN